MLGLHANDWLPVVASDASPVPMRGEMVARPAAQTRNRVEVPVAALSDPASQASGQSLWVATSPDWSALQLGQLLGQLRAGAVRVEGFADAATVLCAWLKMLGPVLQLEVGAHSAALSLVNFQSGQYRLQRRILLTKGIAALTESWLRLASESMVRQTRFDPLHDAAHEQVLRQNILQLALQAQQQGEMRFPLTVESRDLELQLSRDQFITAAEEWYLPLREALQSLCAGVGEFTMLVPESVSALPGLAEALQPVGARPVLVLANDAVARAVSLLPPLNAGATDAVQYLAQLDPFALSAPHDLLRPLDRPNQRRRPTATHLIFDGVAVPIPREGLVLGRQPGSGSVLQLPEGIAGLSRRHCTVQAQAHEAILIDHSRFGAFIDGQRVPGRALLQAGSTLRLGTPGIELPLIALAAAE